MILNLLQIALSSIFFLVFRKNEIRYLACITACYFISYFYSGTYDVPLSVYMVFILLGIGVSAKLNFIDMVLVIYPGIYVIAGIFSQEIFATMTTFVTRYAYIPIFFLRLNKIKSSSEVKAQDYRFLVRLGLLIEILIVLLVWSRHGVGTRIVTNHQGIGAGIAIGLIIVIGYCYYQKIFTEMETLTYCIISVVVTMLSGTRGYMIMLMLPLLVIMLMYVTDVRNNGRRSYLRVGIVLCSMALLTCIITMHWDQILTFFRLNQSLGYRENENKFVEEIFIRAPLINKLFGFGFAGNAIHVDGFYEAIQAASWNRSYMSKKLLTRTIFHNYWYTILFKQGICGVIYIIAIYATIIKNIITYISDRWIKILMLFLVIGSMISITFRITATCSIFEMYIVAHIIYIYIQKNNRR